MKFFGRKKESEPAEGGRLTGVKRKAKVSLTLVVVGMVLAGASTGMTARGFSKGAVEVSEYFVVDVREGTGVFWVELQNKGLLPLDLDVSFTLRHANSDTALGEQTAHFELGPRGADRQTYTFHLTPTALAVLRNGEVLSYTPSVQGDYAWFIPLSERELDAQTLTVQRDNALPQLNAITLNTTPVEAGSEAIIALNASDADGDTLSSEFTIDGGSVLAVEDNGLRLRWRAPYGVGSYTFTARISDGVDYSNYTTLVIPVVDTVSPVLALTVEPDYAADRFALSVGSNEPLLEAPQVEVTYDNGSGPGSAEAVTLVAQSPTSWQGNYSLQGGGRYELVATARDFAGNSASHALNTTHTEISATPDAPVTVGDEEVSLEVAVTANLTAPLSISRAGHGEATAPEGAVELERYLIIDTNESLRGSLHNVTVRVNYTAADEAALAAQGLGIEALKLYFWNGTAWVWERNATIDTIHHQLVVVLDHLSIFGVFGSNIAPSADAGADQVVAENRPVQFYGDASDIDGHVVYYEWDFENDGTWDWNSSTSGNANHTYPAAGVYTARLRVTDDGDATSFDTMEVTVGMPPEDASWGLPGPGLPLALLLVLLLARYRAARRRR